MDFPFYTPFMEGRSNLEAMLEHVGFRPDDYYENEFTLERKFTHPWPPDVINKFIHLQKAVDKTYVLIGDMYQEIKARRPQGKFTFWIDSNWTLNTSVEENGVGFFVWMRGAWCDSKFMDEPAGSIVANHIPKEMMEGY